MKSIRCENLPLEPYAMRWLLIVSLMLLTDIVHAQAACPPGMIPYSTGNDVSSCGPDNSQEQQQRQPPPPRWVDQWGAIATYEPNGSLGTATNMPSQNQAEQAALTDCQSKHNSVCKIQLTYHNQCAAMVVSDKGYNTGSAATVDEAIRTGMKICKDSGDPNCHVYYSACSLPVRIQ